MPKTGDSALPLLPRKVPLEDWSAVVMELIDQHGLTQPQIAEVCGCGQSTISDLARGETKDPRHRIGEALRKLLEAKRREAAQKAVAAPAPADGAEVPVQLSGQA